MHESLTCRPLLISQANARKDDDDDDDDDDDNDDDDDDDDDVDADLLWRSWALFGSSREPFRGSFGPSWVLQDCAKTTSDTKFLVIPILMRMSRTRASFLKRRQIRKLTQHPHFLRMSQARASFLTTAS